MQDVRGDVARGAVTGGTANVQHTPGVMYTEAMDVAISEFRADLRRWVDHARAGHDVVVTERGIPVARLVPVVSAGVLERLERDGVITRPKAAGRPTAVGRGRVRASGPVSALVAELRR